MPAPASKRYNRQQQKAAKQAVEEDGSSSSDEELVPALKVAPSSSSTASILADDASVTSENEAGKTDEVQPKKRKVSNARWTGDMDNALRSAVADHGEDWANVAQQAKQIMAASFTNPNGPSNYQQSLLDLITQEACATRWEVVGNDESAKNRPNWGEAEKGQLTELVEQALNGDGSNLSKTINIGADKLKTISWVNIAKILNREPEDVNYMWTKMRLQKFKRGAFSTEEDRIIIARVREWYAKPADARPKTGLWVALEKELNREDKRISERWRSILSKRVTITVNESISPPVPMMAVQPAAIAVAAATVASSSDKPEPKKRGRKPSSEKDDAEPTPAPVAVSAPVMPVEDEETPAHAASKPGKRKRKLNALNENQAAAAAVTPAAAPEPTPTPTPVPVTTVRIIEDIIEKPESVRWNDEMDDLLKIGMQLYNNDWAKIADHINNNAATMKSKVDDTKCRGRWYRALRKKE